MSRRAALLTLSIALLSIALAARQSTPARPAAPQQPSLTFRSLANYVEVDAIVTDAAGDPVGDLTAADFDLVEDGRTQIISVCAFISIPIARPDPRPAGTSATAVAVPRIEPDVVTNEKGFDGRVFVIVLDAFHVAPSRGNVVRREAENFIDRYLGENDIAAIVQVGTPAAGQEFTTNKRLLKAAVARFAGQALPSATANINADALVLDQIISPAFDPGPPQDRDAGMRDYMARASFSSVRRLAEYMGELHGRRKALLLFSEGIGIDLLKGDHGGSLVGFEQLQPDPQSLQAAQQDMIATAARSNVSIYPVDPRGLTAGLDDFITIGTTPAPATAGRDYSNPLMMSDMANEEHRAQDSLRTYAEQTGGLAMVNRNDMDAAFDRIVRDNSSYYVLGYASPDPKHDGRYHRVSVKVKRPGLQVRARHGYVAPDEKPSAKVKAPPDAVTQLLVSPVPVGGLAMRANAGVIKGLPVRSTVHLTVEFSGQDVALKSSGGLFTNDIDVEYLALDMKGSRQAGGREIAHLQLRPETRAAFPKNGVRYVTEFELAPGRYQVRVAARERLGGRTGSVFCDVDVPDFATLPLSMSDLLITSSGAARTPTPNNTSTIGTMLPAPTTTAREFTAAETLTVAASIYDSDTRAGHQVDLKATVRSDAGTQVFLREDHRDGATLPAAKGGFNWVVPVPLRGLAPGRYVLTIEARSTLNGVEPVRKETEFRIK